MSGSIFSGTRFFTTSSPLYKKFYYFDIFRRRFDFFRKFVALKWVILGRFLSHPADYHFIKSNLTYKIEIKIYY